MVDGKITEQSAAQVGAPESKSRRKIHKRLIVEFIERFERKQQQLKAPDAEAGAENK